jgi:nicotinamidase-related amidase
VFKSSDSILLVVDVQPDTIKSDRARVTTDKIISITQANWDSIYAVKWFSDHGSTFHLARGTLLREEDAGNTHASIEQNLTLETFSKQAPSAFSNRKLASILEKEISSGKNIFVVGFDYYDCVLSTVLDAHSRNLRVYAIDELCGVTDRCGEVDVKLIEASKLILDSASTLVSIDDIYMDYC